MTKAFWTGAFVLMLFAAGQAAPAAGAEPGVLKVTYVANEGFLIEGGGKKVLIDALFDNGFDRFDVPPADVMRRMMAGEAPFDGIDLLLFTHHDSDHFNAQLVIPYLRRHRHVRLVAHKQAVDDLRVQPGFADIADRIDEVAIESGERSTLTAGGIAVDVLGLDHSHSDGEQIEAHNLAFAVELGGVRFLHMGDAMAEQNIAALEVYPFDRKHVDVLFLTFWDLSAESRKLVAERIKPANIVAMHLRPKDIAAETKEFVAVYPHATAFRTPMQTASFP